VYHPTFLITTWASLFILPQFCIPIFLAFQKNFVSLIMRKTQLPTPLPVQQFARCVNDANQPAGYIGDWPTAGRVYPVRVLPHVRSGQPQVHVLGFYAERPYGAFAAHRFETVATLWMN
jgi:hypothetical protein